MANMGDLANFLDGIAEPLARIASQKAKEAAVFALTKLLESTPVDTGAALSNWKVSLDAPDFEAIPAYLPSPKGKVIRGVWLHLVDPFITRSNNAPPTMDVAKAVLLGKQPGQAIFITNNVEYIQELNHGSSLQAPIGFVDVITISLGDFVQAESDPFGTRFNTAVL